MSEKQPISRSRKLIAAGAVAVAAFGAGRATSPEHNATKSEAVQNVEAETSAVHIDYLNKNVAERINADEPVDFVLARLDIGEVTDYSEKTPNGIYSITKSIENPLLIMDVPAGKDAYTDDMTKWYLGSATYSPETDSYDVNFQQFDSDTMRLELHSALPNYPNQAIVGSTKTMNNAAISNTSGFQMQEQVLANGQHMAIEHTGETGLTPGVIAAGSLQVAVEHPYFSEPAQ